MFIRKLFQVNNDSGAINIGLLVFRVSFGFFLFLKHGLEKLTGYSQALVHFKDPIHIGAPASLAMALFSDSICSVLIVFGLATRAAATYVFTMLFIIFITVHNGDFFHGPEHVEIVMLYLTGFLAMIFTGPGKYSLDALISKHFRP